MIPAIFLLLLVVVFRVLLPWTGEMGVFGNFSPLAAIALCGTFVLPRRWAIALPLVALFLSDVALNVFFYKVGWPDASFWVRYGAFLAIALGGVALRARTDRALPALLPASLAGSVFFYLATNSASWLVESAYAKTLAGWWQALTVGVPGFPPTWVFFRNTLVSDLLFTFLFAMCLVLSARRREVTAETVTV